MRYSAFPFLGNGYEGICAFTQWGWYPFSLPVTRVLGECLLYSGSITRVGWWLHIYPTNRLVGRVGWVVSWLGNRSTRLSLMKNQPSIGYDTTPNPVNSINPINSVNQVNRVSQLNQPNQLSQSSQSSQSTQSSQLNQQLRDSITASLCYIESTDALPPPLGLLALLPLPLGSPYLSMYCGVDDVYAVTSKSETIYALVSSPLTVMRANTWANPVQYFHNAIPHW
jgi:hypothetical protein